MNDGNRKVAVVGRVDPGISAVFQVIVYDVLSVRQIDSGIRQVASKNSTVLQYAVYSDELLQNGWEPFEQPSPCAYVPSAYADLVERPLAHFGALLIGQRARRGEFQAFLAEGDSSRVAFLELDRAGVHDALADICRRVGLQPQMARETVSTIEEPVSLATLAA
jgi:hypothetical protein